MERVIGVLRFTPHNGEKERSKGQRAGLVFDSHLRNPVCKKQSVGYAQINQKTDALGSPPEGAGAKDTCVFPMDRMWATWKRRLT